jgi:hypothetical protein
MDALLERLASDDFLEGVVVSIHEWATTREGLRLVLALGGDGSGEREQWVIECVGVRACRIGWALAHHVKRLTDHVLLAPYIDPRVTLAIRGPVRDARHAIADVWQAHYQLAEDWFPLTAFLNNGMPFADLLQSSSAICAEGPSRFIAAYQSALVRNGIDAYTPWQRSPKIRLEESRDISLLLLEPHYIVASGFGARRVGA